MIKKIIYFFSFIIIFFAFTGCNSPVVNLIEGVDLEIYSDGVEWDSSFRSLTFKNVVIRNRGDEMMSVFNSGSSTAVYVDISFFLSLDAKIGNSDDIYLGSLEYRDSIDGSGDQVEVPETYTEFSPIPNDFGGCNYYGYIGVDSLSRKSDIDYSNNFVLIDKPFYIQKY